MPLPPLECVDPRGSLRAIFAHPCRPRHSSPLATCTVAATLSSVMFTSAGAAGPRAREAHATYPMGSSTSPAVARSRCARGGVVGVRGNGWFTLCTSRGGRRQGRHLIYRWASPVRRRHLVARGVSLLAPAACLELFVVLSLCACTNELGNLRALRAQWRLSYYSTLLLPHAESRGNVTLASRRLRP